MVVNHETGPRRCLPCADRPGNSAIEGKDRYGMYQGVLYFLKVRAITPKAMYAFCTR
jgi:hypothetical protein